MFARASAQPMLTERPTLVRLRLDAACPAVPTTTLHDGPPSGEYLPIGRSDSRYGWTPQHDVVMKVAIDPTHTLRKGYQAKERSPAFNPTHPTHRDHVQMLRMPCSPSHEVLISNSGVTRKLKTPLIFVAAIVATPSYGAMALPITGSPHPIALTSARLGST